MSTTAYAAIAAACFLGVCVCIGIGLYQLTHDTGQHASGERPFRMPDTYYDQPDDPDFDDEDEDLDDDEDEDYGYDDDEDDYPTEMLMNIPSQVEIWAGFAPWEALINSGELASTPWIPAHLRKVAA